MSVKRLFQHALPTLVCGVTLVAVPLFLVACGTPTETPIPVRLSLAADRSALSLADDLAAAYHAAQPHILIHIEPMGNALAAAQAVREGHADMALSTVLPNADDPIALRTQAIAQDAMAVAVHPDNPLAGIDLAQASAIFHGDLRNWSQLGGESSAIQVLAREPASGPRKVLEQAVLDGQTLTPMAIILPGEREFLDFIANDRTAIGLIPTSWLDGRVKALKLNGIEPKASARQPAAYPVTLPVFLLSSDLPAADVVEFQRFVQGRDGQRVIARRLAPTTNTP